MLRFVRAGLAAAFLALVLSPATAAEKLFKQSSLDEAAIKLEAQIKSDAGTVAKPPAALRRDIDAAFQKNDFRTGMLVLGQLVTVAPDDASSWLRLSRTILQIKPRDDREKALLLDRASTAAYIAYGRAGDRNLEADSLSVLGRTLADREQWRGALNAMRASLELRETADLRGQYEKLRSEHMVSGCSTSPSTPTRSRRARVSSFQRICPVVVRISHLLSRLAVLIGRRFQRTTNNSASRVSNTENAIR
jgi:hypothetical protein